MTVLHRHLAALRMAAATFWHFSRPPRELEIIEETPAVTPPQAIPGDDANTQAAAPSGDPVFYFMSFTQAADGELTWRASTELNVADIVQMTGEDVDEFLAQPAVVQDKFCGNLLAGLPPAEALVIAQVDPAGMN